MDIKEIALLDDKFRGKELQNEEDNCIHINISKKLLAEMVDDEIKEIKDNYHFLTNKLDELSLTDLSGKEVIEILKNGIKGE